MVVSKKKQSPKKRPLWTRVLTALGLAKQKKRAKKK